MTGWLGVSLGDVTGIGPEVTLKAIAAARDFGLQVVKVATLSQAVDDLEALKTGHPVPSC